MLVLGARRSYDFWVPPGRCAWECYIGRSLRVIRGLVVIELVVDDCNDFVVLFNFR